MRRPVEEKDLVVASERPRKLSRIAKKTLSSKKVLRALEELHWDPEAFMRQYEKRAERAPDAVLLRAGAAFESSGDLEAFKRAVSASNTRELYAKLGRYQAWKHRAERR